MTDTTLDDLSAQDDDAVVAPREPRRILIILPRQLGDVLLGTPLARVLKARYPKARITWCAHPMARQILEGNTDIDEVLLHPVKPKLPKAQTWRETLVSLFACHWRPLWSWLLQELLFVVRLRMRRFDVVIDAMNNPRTALQSFFTGAALRISFSTRAPRNYAFHALVARRELNEGYLGGARLKLLAPLGVSLPEVTPRDTTPVLPRSVSDEAKARGFLEQVQRVSRSGRFIILSPTHRHLVRRWPAERYVELGACLAQATGDAIVWMWGPGEEEYVRSMASALAEALAARGMNSGLSLVPPLLTLREAAVLSGWSRVWIGNSNGLSHVAVAGGARTVEIHGPTDPASWTHPDKTRHRSVQRRTGCIQCGRNTCKLPRRECLDDLGVDEVLKAVDEVLN